MRKHLKEKEGQRLRFSGTVDRYGTKAGYCGVPVPTICIKQLVYADTGQTACDHVWFSVGKQIDQLNLKPGDRVDFDARISTYTKGYVNIRQGIDNRQIDYRLSHPTKLERVQVVTNVPIAA